MDVVNAEHLRPRVKSTRVYRGCSSLGRSIRAAGLATEALREAIGKDSRVNRPLYRRIIHRVGMEDTEGTEGMGVMGGLRLLGMHNA